MNRLLCLPNQTKIHHVRYTLLFKAQHVESQELHPFDYSKKLVVYIHNLVVKRKNHLRSKVESGDFFGSSDFVCVSEEQNKEKLYLALEKQ